MTVKTILFLVGDFIYRTQIVHHYYDNDYLFDDNCSPHKGVRYTEIGKDTRLVECVTI